MKERIVKTSRELAVVFWNLKQRRYKDKKRAGRRRRAALSKDERAEVLRKTAGRCHICGGVVGERWHADHVFAHSTGGPAQADNYLPTHPTCNNYRWDYLPEEFQLVMKLGVWAKTQIERETTIGSEIAEKFLAYESHRRSRRKK